ncbi:MAG TPA: SufE family protein [Thermoanaerobaculia bacterium]|nr:SufE family protein [Thermoanaerobaculia bacterium]
MPELPPKLDDLLATLDLLEDRTDRIQYLIDVADRFREVPERLARRPFPEEHRVQGCESEAFVWAERRDDGTLDYHFAVENPQGVSAKSLAVILGETLSGTRPEEALRLSNDVVYRVFGNELSMGKSMGLIGMICKVQAEARKLAASG